MAGLRPRVLCALRASCYPARMRTRILSLALIVFAVACRSEPLTAPAPTLSGPALNEITDAVIKEHVKTLSSDEFEGRAPSTKGGALAAQYLADELKSIGIEPAGENGTYFQEVPIIESVVNRNFALSVPGRVYRYYDDVVAFSGVERPQVQAQGDIVFVGHGIVAPEQQWNDYAGANVKGKWVMIMVNDPPAPADEPNLFGGKALTYYGRWTYKFEEAARQGAAGGLLVYTDETPAYSWEGVQA